MPGDYESNDLLRPQSPEVYRRRRTVALILLVVVVAIIVGLVWWLVSLFRPAPEEGQPAPTAVSSGQVSTEPSGSASPSPASSEASPAEAGEGSSASGEPAASDGPSASASSTAEAAQASACPPGDIVISAATDQPTYAEGKEPVLELRVDNTGEEPCEANLGTSQQVFTVYSGSDRIFSTEDCQVDSQDAMVEISPDEQERARFTWPRVRSAPGCEEVSAEPRSGTYRLEVSLGELTAQPVTFNLQ